MNSCAYRKETAQNKNLSTTIPRTPGKEQVNDLMKQHLGLVYYAWRSMGNDGKMGENEFNAGMVGLWQALMRYDASREVSFSTFAIHYISGYIRRTYWESVNEKNLKMIAASQLDCEDKNFWQLTATPSYGASSRQEEASRELDELLQKVTLTTREKTILEMIRSGYNMQEIGNHLGISRERVRQIRTEVVNKLQRVYTN